MIEFDVLGALDLRKEGVPVRAVLVQPRRLALLAYLAVARPRGFQSRDRLLALFWPDSDQDRARSSLRQALHQLRRALGEDVFLARGDREIAVNPTMLRCDAVAFDEAIDADRLDDALNRYRGDFLAGFFLDGAPEAERFIEEERDRYRRAAIGAAWRLVAVEEERGDKRAATVRARRALALDPLDETGLRRLLQLLAETGERVTALRVYDDFARRLERELELTPARETSRLVERLRDHGPQVPPPAPPTAVAARGAAPEAASQAPARHPPTGRASRLPSRRPWLAIAAATVVVAGLALAWSRWAEGPSESAASAADDVSTIAVLPFVNSSGDAANEYLADGLSEELMARLSRIPGLNVAGRTSAFTFKGKDVSVDSIGRALRVGHVLEGSVRVTGSRIRIVAALIDAQSGYHAWSDTYDGDLDDVLSVQDRIARAIVAALRPRFTMAAEGDGQAETADVAAHTDLLRGLQALRVGGPEDYAAARVFLARALARDPNYAQAHALLAGVQMVEAIRGVVPRDEGYAAAARSAERALAINPEVPAAYGILGRIAQDYRWDYQAADLHLQRAISLSPSDETWYRQRARLLSVLGRNDEAVALARRSTTLDPLAPGAHRYLGVMQYHARQYDTALDAFGRALALAPNQPYTLAHMGHALSAAGRHRDAVAATDRALELAPDDQIVLSAGGASRAAAGDTAGARQLLDRLLALPRPSPYLAAEVLAQLRERERMFDFLERGVAERDPLLSEVGAMPLFDPYRDDPRMQRLLERIGLSRGPSVIGQMTADRKGPGPYLGGLPQWQSRQP